MRLVYLLLLAAAAVPAVAADKHGATGGHRHGIAQLQVAVQGQELHIALEGPADNVLGFERAPKNDEQKRTLQRVEQQLHQPSQLFSLPAAARCTARPARVAIKLPPPGSREQHSEVEAEWRWTCAAPAALGQVEVGLFTAFPKLKELHTQAATPNGQNATRLTPRAAQLRLMP
jgi:hypothetical protein